MNAHNKTQLTHAKINCALKDSSCDLPLSKILKFTILASNASSSSTNVLKCPHNKDDFIFTHNSSTIYSFGITYNSHTHKDEHMHDFTQRFALIFQAKLISAHLRSQRSFKACNGVECKVVYSNKPHFMRVMGEWIKRGHNCSSFFQEKDKAQRRVQARFTCLTRLSTKESQQDAKSSHIVYATSFGLIVAAHSFLFD
ncbi:hypothetical protein H5410_051448 [Solanum commersonii]|uniref:Uncharacterized protein n=1 Tax=Solanum commersonii TaxID=4109 RepID=A0A9J5X010_SOLCO|nr:hypothetical protein H5410_051448 [Solanum commersonii]